MNFNVKSAPIFYDQRSHTQNQTRFPADVGLTTEKSPLLSFPSSKSLNWCIKLTFWICSCTYRIDRGRRWAGESFGIPVVCRKVEEIINYSGVRGTAGTRDDLTRSAYETEINHNFSITVIFANEQWNGLKCEQTPRVCGGYRFNYQWEIWSEKLNEIWLNVSAEFRTSYSPQRGTVQLFPAFMILGHTTAPRLMLSRGLGWACPSISPPLPANVRHSPGHPSRSGFQGQNIFFHFHGHRYSRSYIVPKTFREFALHSPDSEEKVGGKEADQGLRYLVVGRRRYLQEPEWRTQTR